MNVRPALLLLLAGCDLGGVRYIGADFGPLTGDAGAGGNDDAAPTVDGGPIDPDLLPPGAPTDSVYFYWTLDDARLDVAQDVSGSQRHGTLTNAPSLSEPAPVARAGNLRGRFFNGTGERASYRAEEPLARFTVAFWMKPATADSVLVFARSDGLGTAMVELGIGPGGRIELRADGEPPQGACAAGAACVLAAEPVVRDQWVHLALVAESGAALRLVIDGAEQGAVSLDAFANAGALFELGGTADLTRAGLRGVIDDVIVYERPLAPAELTALAAR